MDILEEHEHGKHQKERGQLETLRETLKSQHSVHSPEVYRSQYGPKSDPMIYPGLYAPSGFNIMDILISIRTRPNPTFDLGAIDDSVSLLLCDMAIPDMPIVYCTETFQKLVGYPESEILGRNCRFLQHPSEGLAGQVGTGLSDYDVSLTRRRQSDVSEECDTKIMEQNSTARVAIKNCVANSVEGQVRFINYRYNGERFWNLLSIVPIVNGGMRYFVGLQADLGPVGIEKYQPHRE